VAVALCRATTMCRQRSPARTASTPRGGSLARTRAGRRRPCLACGGGGMGTLLGKRRGRDPLAADPLMARRPRLWAAVAVAASAAAPPQRGGGGLPAWRPPRAGRRGGPHRAGGRPHRRPPRDIWRRPWRRPVRTSTPWGARLGGEWRSPPASKLRTAPNPGAELPPRTRPPSGWAGRGTFGPWSTSLAPRRPSPPGRAPACDGGGALEPSTTRRPRGSASTIGRGRQAAQSSLERGRTQAANRHVLDSKNLLAPPSQYPVARFSVQVVCNKVLHGSHL